MVVIRERDQIETEDVSAAWFLRSADFQAGADDVRPAPTTEATAPREAGEPIMAIVCRS
jgi:hypothetical protein